MEDQSASAVATSLLRLVGTVLVRAHGGKLDLIAPDMGGSGSRLSTTLSRARYDHCLSGKPQAYLRVSCVCFKHSRVMRHSFLQDRLVALAYRISLSRLVNFMDFWAWTSRVNYYPLVLGRVNFSRSTVRQGAWLCTAFLRRNCPTNPMATCCMNQSHGLIAQTYRMSRIDFPHVFTVRIFRFYMFIA